MIAISTVLVTLFFCIQFHGLLLLQLAIMFTVRSVVQALLLSASVVVAIQPFEELSEVPRGWSLVGTAEDATAIKLRLSLKQQNVDKFYEEMIAVSTPDNAKYGQHYEGLELRSLLAPTDETSNTVISWLLDNNITSIADDGDWVVLQTNVGAANKLLNTEFQWFRNADEKTPVLRTLQYSVPDEIASHINFVQPTTRFGGIQKLKSTVQIVEDGEAVSALKWTPSASSKVDPACNTSITPTCLLQLYNVHYKGDPKSGSRVGYASFLEEYARYSDLEKFEDAYAPYAAGENFTVVKFHGGLDDQNSTADSGEANLDNQYALSLGFPNPVTEFSVGGRGLLIPDGASPTPSDNTNEPYLDFLLALLKLPNSKIPQVISISYGENEQVSWQRLLISHLSANELRKFPSLTLSKSANSLPNSALVEPRSYFLLVTLARETFASPTTARTPPSSNLSSQPPARGSHPSAARAISPPRWPPTSRRADFLTSGLALSTKNSQSAATLLRSVTRMLVISTRKAAASLISRRNHTATTFTIAGKTFNTRVHHARLPQQLV